jgi:hypothetical protein
MDSCSVANLMSSKSAGLDISPSSLLACSWNVTKATAPRWHSRCLARASKSRRATRPWRRARCSFPILKMRRREPLALMTVTVDCPTNIRLLVDAATTHVRQTSAAAGSVASRATLFFAIRTASFGLPCGGRLLRRNQPPLSASVPPGEPVLFNAAIAVKPGFATKAPRGSEVFDIPRRDHEIVWGDHKIVVDQGLRRTARGALHRPCRHPSADVKRSAQLPLIEEAKRLC